MKKQYFCDECNAIFEAEPSKLMLSPRCPECGCYCTYENNPKGRAESIRDLIAYENEMLYHETE